MKDQARLAKARVDSLSRHAVDLQAAAAATGDGGSKVAMRRVVSPPSLSKTLRNTGVVLLVAPDPFTDVLGVAFIGASYAARRREAASLETMRREAARAARLVWDLQSLL